MDKARAGTDGWKEMELLAHPLTIFSACALTLLAALWMYFSLKRDLARLEAAAASEREARAAAEEKLRSEIRQLAADLEEERKAALSRAAPPQQSMNLSKRSQALRMHRLGRPPEEIARTLGLSRMEVDLLLKVHRTVLESYSEGARMRMELGTSAAAATPAEPAAGIEPRETSPSAGRRPAGSAG